MAVDSYGRMLLVESCLSEGHETLSFLIGLGLNVNHQDSFGETALYAAARSGNIDAVTTLLKHNADIKIISRHHGETLLHTAFNDPVMTDILLDSGMEIDPRDNYGQTPLAVAVDNHQVQTALLLVSRGASLEACTDSGDSIRDLAIATEAPGFWTSLEESVRRFQEENLKNESKGKSEKN